MTRGLVVLLCLFFSVPAFAGKTVFSLQRNIEVTVTEADFRESDFAIEGCSVESSICRINGHIPFGVTFGLPKTYLKSITISVQGTCYGLDVADMYNAWGNRPLEHAGGVRYFGGSCLDEENCQFRGLFSDGAGTFVAEWIVVDGYATRTVLSGSNDLVNLFTKHIDPPEFD